MMNDGNSGKIMDGMVLITMMAMVRVMDDEDTGDNAADEHNLREIAVEVGFEVA